MHATDGMIIMADYILLPSAPKINNIFLVISRIMKSFILKLV